MLVSLNRIKCLGREGSHGFIRLNYAHLLPVMDLVTSFIAWNKVQWERLHTHKKKEI